MSVCIAEHIVRLFGRPFVKRFALCYRSVVLSCLSCLSVTFVHCGQTVGRIKTKLGMEVGLGPGHIVLDREPAALQKGNSPPPIYGPCLMWPNAWMDQDATWYGGRPQPRWHCVRWGSSFPLPNKGGTAAPPPFFGPCVVTHWLDGSRCHLVRR